MLFNKQSPGDFTICVLAATLAMFTPQISAANLLEDVVPYYGPASASSSASFPYSDFFSTAPPTASLYAPPSASAPPHPNWSAAPSGQPYSFGTAPLSSWMPLNSTVPYPTGGSTGGWTHKVTPTSKYTPLVTKTSAVTVPAPTTPAPAPPSPGTEEQSGAATLATSFAGLVFAAGIALLAL